MKKRKRGPRASTEQLLAMLKQARIDYDNSDAHKTLVAGIQACPENAGCYEAFQALIAFQGTREITEQCKIEINTAAERWRRFSDYCPHCSKIVAQNRETRAYQTYKTVLNRISKRLGVPPATVLGIELKEE